MTQVGAYDYQTLHVLHEGSGVFSFFERRLKRIVLAPSGKPIEVLPDGVSLSYIIEQSVRGNKIIRGWVLLPVKEQDDS